MRGVFLDLNGTLVEPVKVRHLSELRLLPRAVAAVQLLNQHGFCCPVITVQSRIAKQYFSLSDFHLWFATLQATLETASALLLGPYICPHQRRDQCACRKPHVLLYEQAIAACALDVARAAVVGDTIGGMQAAQRLGCVGCLVQTGQGLRDSREHAADQLATYVASDVLDAAEWVVEHVQ